MKKPLVFVILSFIVVTIIGGIYFVYSAKAKKTTIAESPEIANITPSPITKPEQKTWNDEAGFSFQYPATLTAKIIEEDSQSYAHVELTGTESSGSAVVLMQDANAPDASTWLKNSKTYASSSRIDTLLGTLPAIKVIGTDSIKDTVVIAVTDGYIYVVKTPTSGTWDTVRDSIVSSFSISGSSGSEQTSVGSDEIIQAVDEEEVIE